MLMKFRAHDTFFIRKGWLSKGMRNIEIAADVFTSKQNNPMDVLGIGANMVKALRYWLVAVGLTQEVRIGGRSAQEKTDFGRIIYENDRYFEELGTLWLLHYKLATNKDEASAWYYFFNEFKMTEFTRDDFVTQINKYLRNTEEGEKPERTLEDDYNCIINTYVPRIKSNPEKVQPESNIDCPLGELGLVDIANKKDRVYKKSSPKKDTLHPLILLAVIIDQHDKANPSWHDNNKKREVRISAIQNDINNAGKVFNLDIISLTNLLYQIELLKHIKVIRTAGLDVIQILTDMTFEQCVEEYYASING